MTVIILLKDGTSVKFEEAEVFQTEKLRPVDGMFQSEGDKVIVYRKNGIKTILGEFDRDTVSGWYLA